MNDNSRQTSSRRIAAPVCQSATAGGSEHRRGNTLVLVAAILALLAIIATAYVTRTQSQRAVSVAQQSATMRGENVDAIAENLADLIAGALFVRPIDTDDPSVWDGDYPTLPASSNFARTQPAKDAARYGVDKQWLDVGDGLELYTFGYNHAPYHTVPFTNWPTPQTLFNWYGFSWQQAVTMVPAGPANPGNPFDVNEPIPGAGNLALAFESNPMGNPGFGDARWLADTEPVRWVLPSGYEAFSHWRKLTNIATPNNNWRVVADISNVDRSIVTDLTIPIEQWPAYFQPNRGAQVDQSNSAVPTGDTSLQFINFSPLPNGFLRQWAYWLGFRYDQTHDHFEEPVNQPMWQYLVAYGNTDTIEQAMPSNFVRLSNLRGFGDNHGWQEGGVFQDRPESAFIRGTARHSVGRVLADTTGDGYTDAFWFDPGLPPRDGVRQVVAVRIEDNSSRLNANVATRFHRNEFDFDAFDFVGETRTRGDSPADIALVGQLRTPGQLSDNDIFFGNHWNVGLYDNPANWRFLLFADGQPVTWGYNDGTTVQTDLWRRHLTAIGLPVWNPGGLTFNQFITRIERLDYWRRSARHGLAGQPMGYYNPDDVDDWLESWQYTPFSLHDDVALRMYHGNNNSWLLSGFEQSAQVFDQQGLLRAHRESTPRHEQSEYLHQLYNRQLLLDNRRKLTLHSGARNDQLPPWLWWENRYAPGWDFEDVNICADPADEPGIDGVRAAMPVMARNVILNLCYGDLDVAAANAAFRRFLAQSRQKLDLREYEDRYSVGYVDGSDGWLQPDYHLSAGDIAEHVGRLNIRDRLAHTLMMTLTDGPMILQEDRVYTSYYGDYIVPDDSGNGLLEFGDNDLEDRRHYRNPKGNLNNTRRLAASYAANILAHRGNDRVYLRDRVLLPEYGYVPGGLASPGDPSPLVHVFEEGMLEPTDEFGNPPADEPIIGHIALDYQPFLVEALIAHVHEGIFLMEGEYADFEAGYYHCRPKNVTMIMVEIANPFDVPISLEGFRISVFGRPVNLTGFGHVLGPHESRVYYSIPTAAQAGVPINLDEPDVENWLAHFGLFDMDDVTAFNVLEMWPDPAPDELWPRTRQELEQTIKDIEGESDDGGGDGGGEVVLDPAGYSRAIEIERFNHTVDGSEEVWYVVDRIDMTSPELDVTVHQQIMAMTAHEPPPFNPDDPLEERATWYFDANIVQQTCDPDQWPPVGQPIRYEDPNALQWVRISRVWQQNPVLDPGVPFDPQLAYYTPANERNPRYVFGTRQVEVLENIGNMEEPIYHPRIADDNEYYRHWAVIFNQSDLVPGTAPEDMPAELQLLPRPRFGARIKALNLGTFDPADDSTDPIDVITPWVYDANGRFHFPMRMNLKRLPLGFNFFGDDDDEQALENSGFEQVGELLNIWLFGHEIEFNPDPTVGPDDLDWYQRTRTTFAEFMQDAELQALFDWRDEDPNLPANEPQIVNCWQRLLDGELAPPQAGEDDEARAIRETCIEWLTDSDANRVNHLRTRPWKLDVQDGSRTRTIGTVLHRPKSPPELFEDGLLPPFSSPQMEIDLHSRYRSDPRHAAPALPGGLYVLDAFVCDGPGQVWKNRDPVDPVEWYDYWDNELTDLDVQRRRRYNANDFRGKLTPGMININTATPEVLRALPHSTRLVHENWSLTGNPWNRTAWALHRYRERLGAPLWEEGVPNPVFPVDWGPAYAHRGRNVRENFEFPFFSDPGNPGDGIAGFIPGMRGERGMASIGEMTLLTQPGRRGMSWIENLDSPEGFFHFKYDETYDDLALAATIVHENSNWRIDYPTLPERIRYLTDRMSDADEESIEYTEIHPPLSYLYPFSASNDDDVPGWYGSDASPPNWYDDRYPSSARLSTDVQDRVEQAFYQYWDDQGVSDPVWPETAEDAREANLLFTGVSNIVTTRSDVFTVYFRVRSYRQNPSTGAWDATDPEHILDDARYVMLIDRSEVNRPSDKPKILYLERIVD